MRTPRHVSARLFGTTKLHSPKPHRCIPQRLRRAQAGLFRGSTDGYLPAEGIEYIYYDQLDSYYSDQPNDPDLWTIEHFVSEVEQVRQALGLNNDNFFLFGQSWGGMLATEYALAHQQHLKGLIISNMVSDVDAYNRYAREVLGPQMDPEVFSEIQRLEAEEDYENPRYEELLMQHHYTEHVLRMPLDEWPDSIMRTFKHLNKDLYVHLQGYSEFGMTPNATLGNWNRSTDLPRIEVPTLTIGADPRSRLAFQFGAVNSDWARGA